MFKKRVRVSNIQNPELFFDQEFWVDTGALYSFIPEDWLEKIKAEPIETRNLILADGRTDKRLFGVDVDPTTKELKPIFAIIG